MKRPLDLNLIFIYSMVQEAKLMACSVLELVFLSGGGVAYSLLHALLIDTLATCLGD